jgi:methylmalonyl-CoA mutase cobalamin-binding domain/chain
MAEIRCSIKLAARKSGLSTHLIRMWQKRYDAVSPQRTDSNRRLYSEREIERLKLLRAVVDSGHRIGDVARLSDDELRGLAPAVSAAPDASGASSGFATAGEAIEAAIAATLRLDSERLQDVLVRAAAAFGFRGSLERVFAPLAQRIGELWREGTMTAAHEHFASAAIRAFLLSSPRTFAGSASRSVLVVATPAGQLHEVGAVLVAAAAGDLGWRVVFLGTSLPAAEIAGAAIQHRARVVALSIVYPSDDAQLASELRFLRRALPADTRIIVGGRAAGDYSAVLHEIGAATVSDLRQFEAELEKSAAPSAH